MKKSLKAERKEQQQKEFHHVTVVDRRPREQRKARAACRHRTFQNETERDEALAAFEAVEGARVIEVQTRTTVLIVPVSDDDSPNSTTDASSSPPPSPMKIDDARALLSDLYGSVSRLCEARAAQQAAVEQTSLALTPESDGAHRVLRGVARAMEHDDAALRDIESALDLFLAELAE